MKFRVEMGSSELGSCSFYGGCLLTIRGGGFSENMMVTVGHTKCEIRPDTLTSDQFDCDLESTEKVHRITNTGKHAGREVLE